MIDVVYRGDGSGNHQGRLVTVETLDGRLLGPLRHVVKHSPTGMTWGYEGSGCADLARSLIIDALGEDAACLACGGTQRVLFLPDSDDIPVAYDPADPVHVALAEASEGPLKCWDCDNGIRYLPYQEFKREFVGHWPPSGWSITRSQILAWFAEKVTP